MHSSEVQTDIGGAGVGPYLCSWSHSTGRSKLTLTLYDHVTSTFDVLVPKHTCGSTRENFCARWVSEWASRFLTALQHRLTVLASLICGQFSVFERPQGELGVSNSVESDFLHSPDTIGLATGRSTSLQKSGCWFVGGDIPTGVLHVL